MRFITEYSDILDILFNKSWTHSYEYEMKFSKNDDMASIKEQISKNFRSIIIEKGITYPKRIPQDMIEKYPSMFLSVDAPDELKEAFYSRKITSDFILSNPIYRDYLKNIDLEVLYKHMPVRIVKEKNRYGQTNLVKMIKDTFGEEDSLDVMLLYGKYIETVFEKVGLQDFTIHFPCSKEDLLHEMDANIFKSIIGGTIKYDEKMPSHFKNSYPTLFLSPDVPQDIRDKFYNRKFTLDDFNANPDLIETFGHTNIACGFPENVSWVISLFDNLDNLGQANDNRLQIISAYSKIQDVSLQNAFKEYILEYGDGIDIEKVEYASEVLSRLSLSNSSEIFTFRKELATQILETANPQESLNKVEDIFIKNNIPTVGKIYSCFEILHPDFKGFDFNSSMVSPMLKNASTMSKKVIVFSDLIKASFGSNNRSVNAYLRNIEKGSELYEHIKTGQIQYDQLDEREQKELTTFSKHLATLYNNTLRGKKENETFIPTGNVLTDIFDLSKKLSPDGTLDYKIEDRVIRMFCGFAGIDTLEQAKNYIREKTTTADARNRKASHSKMTLEQGDFVKGIGELSYLRNILQNGSVSKEYLGASATSDATPLDTDVSMVLKSDGTTQEKLSTTKASGYGSIWFVLKNDERFITTRTNSETLDTKRDMSKMEVFYTGAVGQDHYGIRTGFASSEINYIIIEPYDSRVGLEIALNGFYIPVANKEGDVIFTPSDYDNLREKMSGLSYYGEDNYVFSENLVTEEVKELSLQIEQSNDEVQLKRTKINDTIKNALEELGLRLKTSIDGDLTEGYVELIDTGSTGRGTNKPGDGDFDFMMRLDRSIFSNPSKVEKIRQTLLKNLGKENTSELTMAGDFRLKDVQIDNQTNVDLDITFVEKTDKVAYSTDVALQDRLTTIRQINPENYKYVVANILLAKQVLKEAEAYKPNRGEVPQGGLGGVGIENWILQNGGSFIDAATSFMEASEGRSFEEFKTVYQIWDFGDNHLAEKRGQYPHDNFVTNNMNESGYNKMRVALKEYMHHLNDSKNQNISNPLDK